MSSTRSRSHPVAVSPGGFSLIGAWLVGFAIVRLTGAAAVVLLLVATFVAMLAAFASGWWRLRSVSIVGIVTPGVATVGESVPVVIDHQERRRPSAPVSIRLHDQVVTLDEHPPTSTTFELNTPGVITELRCSIESAGVGGLVRWRRSQVVTVDEFHVAPAAAGPILPVEHTSTMREGTTTSGRGPKVGELDGTRPWRAGECQQAIHWPSTLRAGEIIAYDRTTSTDSRWSVTANAAAPQLRWTLEEGLRQGHEVVLTDTGTTDVVAVRDGDDVLRWAAIVASSQAVPATSPPKVAIWKRPISIVDRNKKLDPVDRRARLLTAAAALTALWMLLGALGSEAFDRMLTTFGLVMATAISVRYSGKDRPWWARAVVVFIAAAALGRVAVQASGIGGLLAALRGPMPDLLILLVVLHGAEINDRRTNRVHLAITGIVVAYAAGLRIDGRVGWWMLVWGVLAVAAFSSLGTDRALRFDRGTARRIGIWTTAGALATIGLAAFVPVPDGPASLGLPAISNSDPQSNGALVGPDGSPSAPTSTGQQTRGALGQVGGYPGFSTTLDTAVRGDLGDELVMRVRAPEPAFWRGQTFTNFDGRIWTVGDLDSRSTPLTGPTIHVEPTLGDVTGRGGPGDEFVQTYYVEADLPNVIFAAAPVATVIFDGSVFARSDGSIRADRTLAEGTVYSVVSQRIDVTAESLRAEGDVAQRFAEFAGDPNVAQFLEIPESTTPETIELASTLRVEGSTYDTIRAYELWMAVNTAYDLNVPVPEGDAVDDFLFRSKRGFCEQIASSLVVMLRSQGVPARLATGYVPGERDRISGVFEVRASDAHAWVEVWFPESGWQAFDPTATVPLSGEAQRSTVGADAASALIAAITSRPLEIALLMLVVAGLAAALRWIADLRRRRARGPWGVLYDRFMALAPDEQVAPRAAAKLATLIDDRCDPHEIARTLDRVAFDPGYVPDDGTRARLESDIATLERTIRAGVTSS